MREARNQFAGTVLLILAVAAAVAAVLSFTHLRAYPIQDDGVTWMDRTLPNGQHAVVATYLTPGGPGETAGIRPGDQLVKIGDAPIHRALDVPEVLFSIPRFQQTHYTLRRNGIEFQKDNVFVRDAPRDTATYYYYGVGVFYMAIGLFVYFRRTSANKSFHFFILCLASFVACCFRYSGKLNTFDEVMYWGNFAANLFAPAIFLHFCLTFHDQPSLLRRKGVSVLLYLPSAALLCVVALTAQGILSFSTPLLEVRWLFDRAQLGFSLLLYYLGAAALGWDFANTRDPVLRRQLKYLRNGAIVGLTPFTLCYALPYIFGVVPSHVMNLTVLSMGLIPLTWAYAITRYRLMDVDIIFQQGYVYTLATLAVIGTFYGLIFLLFNAQTIPTQAIVVLISFATFVFQPIRRWIQEQLDRYVFYRDRYDSRLTLTEFARELSSETNQSAMLAKVSDRLLRTLSIQQVGCFLYNEGSGQFELHSLTARSGKQPKNIQGQLDLRFLNDSVDRPYAFFERPRNLRDIVSQELPQSVRETIAQLDFTYYVNCQARGRTLAFLGISRTTEGDFLSSDDIELLVTVSNYVAIAIENSNLYSSLQRKANEYERLKEFSENIVESINVGILAVNLEDRVESWNTQIERLTGIARAEAIGKTLDELFPSDLSQRFAEFRQSEGVHNVYKAALNSSIVNIAIAPLVSKEMTQIGRLVIFDDVTDRDELERRLVQADKLSSIGLLAAGVAHEVNTPLAVISTYAQMLAKQVSEDDHKSKLLEKIAKQTFRASEIVNSLLNFSRTSPTEFVETDLNRIITETANLVEHQFEKAGVRTRLKLAPDLPGIRGNGGKLQQVFLNLFLNARDAMPGGGTLEVSSWSESGMVRIEVADSGQGIAPEVVSRIYDPFFTTKGAMKGTGLGLSITYGIVQEHKGVIEVNSTPGQGTTFHLEFPASAVRPLHAPVPVDRPEWIPSNGSAAVTRAAS